MPHFKVPPSFLTPTTTSLGEPQASIMLSLRPGVGRLAKFTYTLTLLKLGSEFFLAHSLLAVSVCMAYAPWCVVVDCTLGDPAVVVQALKVPLSKSSLSTTAAKE